MKALFTGNNNNIFFFDTQAYGDRGLRLNIITHQENINLKETSSTSPFNFIDKANRHMGSFHHQQRAAQLAAEVLGNRGSNLVSPGLVQGPGKNTILRRFIITENSMLDR